MGSVTSIIRGKAKRTNSGTSQNRSELRWIRDVIATSRALWPAKTAQHLAEKTSVSERAAEFWLAGKYDMSLAAARDLLRSEDGYKFLVALVGDDCEARWWARVKLAYEVGTTARAIRSQARKLEQLRERTQQINLDIE
jgi:hypothetical protein